MRRLLPAMLCAVCLPLALVVVLSGQERPAPHTRLVSSWVDTGGAGHLNFDVQGVTKGAVLTARLTLHRPSDGTTAGVRITADNGAWSTYISWLPSSISLTSSAASPSGPAAAAGEVANNAVTVDVSDAIRQSGMVRFLLSNPSFDTPPNVVLSADAGTQSPTLEVEQASDGSAATAGGAASGIPGDSPSATPGSGGEPDSGVGAPSESPQPTTDNGSSGASDGSGGSVVWNDSGSADPLGGLGSGDPSLPVNLNPPPVVLTPSPSPSGDPGAACTLSSILVPSCSIWWGVGTNPLGGESWNQALTDFLATQGRAADVLHYYHVGSGTFPTQLEIDRSLENGQKRALVENWKPELGRTWAQVAAGDPVVDAEIDHEAAYLQSTYTTPFFLAIHHEPENEVIPTAGSGMTAADYADMYRHVVHRLRADGVTNAVFVMDYMGAPKWGEASWWNDLYPGDDVVDWIAEDPYSVGSGGVWRADFAGMVDRRDGSSWPGFYTWATTTHPGKPIMLAEWGVTEDPLDPAAKTDFFNTMLSELPSFPAIKALLYWNAPSTRIDSDPSALAAFQRVATSPLLHVSLP